MIYSKSMDNARKIVKRPAFTSNQRALAGRTISIQACVTLPM